MCGIFGWVGEKGERSLEAMADALRHRGPDGEGYFDDVDGGVSMGMVRLAIVGKEDGGQPFYSQDGSVVVVCNGEIYNWRELRKELEEKGYSFKTECDVEVIPAAWEEWGEGMLSRFNGMFALVLRDKSRSGVFVARDRCGQKPLYYAEANDGALVFASEPVGLFAAGVDKRLNKEKISEYLLLRYVSEPYTLFKGVKQLRSGHCGWVSNGGVKEWSWWHLPKQLDSLSGEAAVRELSNVADAAVKRCKYEDGKTAVFLSGGVDSSYLLSSLKQAGGDLVAITAGFSSMCDESEQARELAEDLGVEHLRVGLSEIDLLHLPEVVKSMQVPVGDALILAFDKLASAASESSCKVAIGGEGVDELFFGYSFIQLAEQMRKIGWLGRRVAWLGLKCMPLSVVNRVSSFPAALGRSEKAKILSWLGSYEKASEWWRGAGLRSLFEPREIRSLLKTRCEFLEPKLEEGRGFVDKQARGLFTGWLQDWSIVRQERNTMAHSVEYRMPFLDHLVIETAFRIPLSEKKGKHVWREMACRASDKVKHERGKQPFYFPLETLLESKELGDLIQDCLSCDVVERRGLFHYERVSELLELARGGDFLPLKQVMALIILELWMREHIDENL